VYVDDLLITSSHDQFLKQFMKELSKRFSFKYLGFPHYFLGIEIVPTKNGLFLNQHKYIRDLLEKFNMAGAKPTNTPLCTTTSLKQMQNSFEVSSEL